MSSKLRKMHPNLYYNNYTVNLNSIAKFYINLSPKSKEETKLTLSIFLH